MKTNHTEIERHRAPIHYALAACMLAIGLAGCGDDTGSGGDDDDDAGGEETGAGGGATETGSGTGTGTGKHPNATDVTCDVVDDCGYWGCVCEDGAFVESAICDNGYCLDAAAACPSGCADLGHGAWSGEASGGP